VARVEKADDAETGSAGPGAASAPDDLVRLTVPAEADFVAVVRLTVQAIAARAGCTDDERSRLRAAAGTAYFEAAADAGPEGTVLVELHTEGHRVLVGLTAVPARSEPTRSGTRMVEAAAELAPRPVG
jgi:hypothetical protein